jgi:hypothetical protein
MDSKIKKLEDGFSEIEKNNQFLEKEKFFVEEKNNKLNNELRFLNNEVNKEKDEDLTMEILIEQIKNLKYNLKEKDIAIDEMTLNITKLETKIYQMDIIMNNNNKRGNNISFGKSGNYYNNYTNDYINEFEIDNNRKDIDVDIDNENNFINQLREKDELINLLQKKLNDLQIVNRTCYELLGKI